MADIVLVPGAYHGGWYFSPIVARLAQAGHRVHTITLSGLAATNPAGMSAINLDQHIADVVALIEDEQLNDVLLCGHSYGGMVIAGARDRLGERIARLVFVDALVPDDGESVWSFWPKESSDNFIDASTDGVSTAPPPGLDPRARAHPLGTFLQPISLGAATYAGVRKTYALCRNNAPSPFHDLCAKLGAQGDWQIEQLDCGHDIMSEAPDLLADLLLKAAA